MENKTVFRVGDVVYHFKRGKGEVIRITDESITVDFPENLNACIFQIGNGYELLSFTPYTLEHGGFSQERPQPVIEKGTPIWVRDKNSSVWMFGPFCGWSNIGRVIIDLLNGEEECFDFYSLENPLK